MDPQFMSSFKLAEASDGPTKFHDLTKDFYRRVFADPLLAPLFGNPDEDHAGRLALYFIAVFHGPDRYSEERGGFWNMVRIHQGRGFTEAQTGRWLAHMGAAIDASALSADSAIQMRRWVAANAAIAHEESHKRRGEGIPPGALRPVRGR